MKFRFLTSTPLDIVRGSGTFVGIHVLAGALQKLGHTVDYESPMRHFPIYTLERLWFNRALRPSAAHDLTVGFDMDGYRIAGPRHVASLKGVIADEVRFERGFTRATMSVQAHCERLHVHRAARVLVTSRYSADRAVAFYGLKRLPTIVPELIDLRNGGSTWPRFPRGRRDSLCCMSAGFTFANGSTRCSGPRLKCARPSPIWRSASWVTDHAIRRGASLSADLNLDRTVTWLGDVSRSQLAAEYNRCHVFCLPSVQEGFGIVLLEAMAAGKPIVAARAGCDSGSGAPRDIGGA